jgi:hypothetical protein
MRKLTFALAAVSLLSASAAASAGPLDSYRQKARPVVVFGEEDNPDFRRQIEIFNRASVGFRERDIVLIPVSTRGGKQDLRALFRVEPEDFQVLLIGKDGGVKLRRREIVNPQEIFRLVDSMPMRRLEAPAARDAGARPAR